MMLWGLAIPVGLRLTVGTRTETSISWKTERLFAGTAPIFPKSISIWNSGYSTINGTGITLHVLTAPAAKINTAKVLRKFGNPKDIVVNNNSTTGTADLTFGQLKPGEGIIMQVDYGVGTGPIPTELEVRMTSPAGTNIPVFDLRQQPHQTRLKIFQAVAVIGLALLSGSLLVVFLVMVWGNWDYPYRAPYVFIYSFLLIAIFILFFLSRGAPFAWNPTIR